jgi:plasmid stabilization system protein ParE
MARVIVSATADADTAEIFTYLANSAGAAVADKYDLLFTKV